MGTLQGWVGPRKARSSSILRLGHPRRKKRRTLEQALEHFSRRLRRQPTLAEALLKKELDSLGLPNKFQHPRLTRGIACIMDFVLPQRVVVEVDGGYHEDLEQMAKDLLRDSSLTRSGFLVLRFTNEEVYRDAAGVAFQVALAVGGRGYRSPSPQPSSRASAPEVRPSDSEAAEGGSRAT